MTTMDPGKFSEYIGKLHQEEERPVALNDIKNLLSSTPANEVASSLENIGITQIFYCLQTKDKVQLNLVCEILTICFEKFNPGDVIKKYTGQFMFLLRHENSSLRKLAVEEVCKCQTANQELLPVPDFIDVFVAVAQLVSDSDVGIANKAICVTSHLPKEAYDKVLDEMKIALKLNSSSKCNALEVVINISKESPELLELSVQHGYLDFLMTELNSTDILYKVNILELLSRLAQTPHGITYLVKCGALDTLSQSNGLLKSNPESALLVAGCFKVFGYAAHLYPRQILRNYPVFFESIYDIIEAKDPELLRVALETLGFIGATIEGKLTLVAFGSKFTQLLELVWDVARGYSRDLKAPAILCLAYLISVDRDPQQKDPVDPRVTLMTREWFRNNTQSPGSMEYIMTLCQNPFIDVKFAAFTLLDAACQHKWGQEMLLQTAGFIEYLLDRKSSYTKESKELTFDIIKRLSQSSCMDAKTTLAIKKFIEEGPFYVEREVEVAEN